MRSDCVDAPRVIVIAVVHVLVLLLGVSSLFNHLRKSRNLGYQFLNTGCTKLRLQRMQFVKESCRFRGRLGELVLEFRNGRLVRGFWKLIGRRCLYGGKLLRIWGAVRRLLFTKLGEHKANENFAVRTPPDRMSPTSPMELAIEFSSAPVSRVFANSP